MLARALLRWRHLAAGKVGMPEIRKRPQKLVVSLQYLRGIAAMMVVYCHGFDQLPWLKAIMPNFGLSGVDLFFVISGFIMVFVTAGAEASPIDFFRRRIVRIVPLYWLFNFANAALLLAFPQLFHTAMLTLKHFVLSLFFIPHLSPAVPPSISPFILLGWTLNYEMFFYAMFALALAVSMPRRVPLTVGLLVSLVILGALSVFERSPAFEFYSNDIVLEFVFGMALAQLFLNGSLARVSRESGWMLIGLGAIGLAAGAYGIAELPRALAFGIPAALMVAGALAAEAGREMRRVQPFLLIGDASYSIYLAHLFPIALERFAWGRLGLPTEGVLAATGFIAVALLGGVLAGIACYLLVERPMLNTMQGWLKAKPAASLNRPALAEN
jgi:peptidoglycan/LPS O-acetylase OafA/YrhL